MCDMKEENKRMYDAFKEETQRLHDAYKTQQDAYKTQQDAAYKAMEGRCDALGKVLDRVNDNLMSRIEQHEVGNEMFDNYSDMLADLYLCLEPLRFHKTITTTH